MSDAQAPSQDRVVASGLATGDDVTKKSGHDEQQPRHRKYVTLISIVSVLVLFEVIFVVLLAIFSRGWNVGPIVDLTYARYRGFLQFESDVNAWLGMRYAAPPIDDLRFAAPQDPIKVDGVQDASKHGKTCLSVNDKPPVDENTGEDCLFIDVYSPSTANSDSRLPVLFFIQGGGFAENANANFNGRGLIEAAEFAMIVVTFNYRVGPYGFIAGDEIGSLNNGLKDQRKALEWVHQHISKFGGNPDHVVLGGDSAGAISVALHMSAYGGNDTNLFHAAAMESPSFATVLTNNQSQFLFDKLVSNTSCTGSSDKVSCLRHLSSDDIQKANQRYPYPGARGLPVFSWNPVIDDDLIQDFTYNLFSQGRFSDVPTLVGDDSNAGTIFAPRNINSLDQSNTFLSNTFPYLNESHIERLNDLYPNNAQDHFPGAGSYWRRTANAYGEMRYMCPNIFLASAIETYGSLKNTTVWNYRYNVQDPGQIANGLGVPHTVELGAIWGPGNMGGSQVPESYKHGKQNADIVPMMQGYWTSFIRSFDPNTHRKEGTPEWKPWDTGLAVRSNGFSILESGLKERLLFDTPVKSTAMETVDSELWARCEYLWSIGTDIQQ